VKNSAVLSGWAPFGYRSAGRRFRIWETLHQSTLFRNPQAASVRDPADFFTLSESLSYSRRRSGHCKLGLLGHQMMGNGKLNELRRTSEPQLLHHSVLVERDGPGTYFQYVSRLLHGTAFRQ